jgi:hypothetical protein
VPPRRKTLARAGSLKVASSFSRPRLLSLAA